MVQRYKFESKSQLLFLRCVFFHLLFPMVQRYKFESKSQLDSAGFRNGTRCFQWFKGTNLKANHNDSSFKLLELLVVSNGSKVQIWKQITTLLRKVLILRVLFPMVQRYKFESKSQHSDPNKIRKMCCFQWFKGTNLKANHNLPTFWTFKTLLFPMVQRYKFESKSQPFVTRLEIATRCFQWFKGTNLKANHNSL